MAKKCGKLSVLGLPLPWLSQLVSAAPDQDTKLSLFSTCKLFRDLTLSRADSIHCAFEINQVTSAQAARSLQQLEHCKQGIEVKLIIKDATWSHEEFDYQQAARFTSWISTLCSHASCVPAQPLRYITCVELKACILGDLVPAEVITCCPNMQQLTRCGWFVKWEHKEYAPLPCPQLKTVELFGFLGPESDFMDISVQQMQQQMRCLCNLQEVVCKVNTEDAGLGAADLFLDSIQVLNTQLVSVKVDERASNLLDVFATAWPLLVHLHLTSQHMTAREVELVLQNAPQLLELYVQSISTHQGLRRLRSSLKHLSLNHVFGSMLAYVPGACLQTLCVGALILVDSVDSDWRCLADLYAALSKVTSILPLKHASPLHMYLTAGNDLVLGPEDMAMLSSVLQLVKPGHITLHWPNGLNEQWLQALSCSKCHTLSLGVNILDAEICRTLMQQLQHVHLLKVLHNPVFEGKPGKLAMLLCALCMMAQRPFSLQVHQALVNILGDDWKVQLMANMRACGHEHVAVDVLEPV